MSSGADIEGESAAQVAAAYHRVAWAGLVILSIGMINAVYYWAGSRGWRRDGVGWRVSVHPSISLRTNGRAYSDSTMSRRRSMAFRMFSMELA